MNLVLVIYSIYLFIRKLYISISYNLTYLGCIFHLLFTLFINLLYLIVLSILMYLLYFSASMAAKENKLIIIITYLPPWAFSENRHFEVAL